MSIIIANKVIEADETVCIDLLRAVFVRIISLINNRGSFIFGLLFPTKVNIIGYHIHLEGTYNCLFTD